MSSLAEILFSTMSMADNYDDRVVDRTDVDSLIVSTAYTPDCGFETAIGDAESFYPVERYDNKADAQKGHEKWCKEIVGKTKVLKLGYPELEDDEEVDLIRE